MKKLLVLLYAVIIATGLSVAQQPVDPNGNNNVVPNPCSIIVTGDFDSECLYDFKDDYFDEYPDLMIACKHSTVTYTAYAYTGTATVSSFIWEVYGDLSHTATGDHCTVDWSDDEWGMVVVSVVTSDGDTCTESRHVKLIDNPTVGAMTVPAYTVLPDGTKVIRVCKGMPVTFIDQSDAGNSDIAGIHWECANSLADPSSTPTYTIDAVYFDDKVTHRVYNNCRCYDEEVFVIEVLTGEILDLECYGTVCEGAVVEYHATAPPCTEYHWYVEGGTIIAGQGTDSPVVQWDHPVNGHGVIGLDGYLCGDDACPAMMSKRVPIIQNHLAIEGQSDVCTGEAVLFSLPVFGATKYTWSITPTTGVDDSWVTNANEIRLVFQQAGTYTLNCTYQCEFLGCGPYEAEELTITVKPQFAITGNNRICVANACDLQTSPSVTATWTVYDLGNGNATVGSPVTGTSFSQTFGTAGRYLVTAENSAWCGPATFVLEVKGVPPAPTAADLDPTNRHTACPYEGIALNGTPSEPNYMLVWEPSCSTASPQLFSGDSVTISYQAEVCDVRVYNYDVVLQCMSADYYVHHVSELTAAPLSLPSNITVCPGTEISWASGQVPDQRSESMLYEWTIEDTKQQCASVQGSHLVPGIMFVVNDITVPETFYMKLRRKFCGGYVDTMINILVSDALSDNLSISGPSMVCVGSEATYTGSGGNPATYRWETDGVIRVGNPVTHSFLDEGIRYVTLCSNPYTYCLNNAHISCTTKTVTVNPEPLVYYDYDYATGTIQVLPTDPSYSYSWYFQATASSPEIPLTATGNSITATSPGTYSCIVTDINTGCVKILRKVFPVDENCNTMTLSASYDICTRTLTLVSPQYSYNVIWSVEGGAYSIVTSGTNNRQADITFEDVGVYTIYARVGLASCYKGEYVHTVNFIPDFEFEQACGSINIINHSRFVAPGSNIHITVTDNNDNIIDNKTIPANQALYTYTPSVPIPAGTWTYHFKLSGYGANTVNPPCDLGDITVTMVPTPSNPITISTANIILPNNTCDNTPIELIATLNIPGLSIASSSWLFSDGSGYTNAGNSVYHTFSSNYDVYTTYLLSVSITDNIGCVRSSAPMSIHSFQNIIYGGILYTLDPIPCPFFNTRNLHYDKDFSDNNYSWWRHKAPTRIPGANPHPTYQSDDYFTYVINDNYCQAEARTFVKFKNAPTARIYVENTNCCVGNEVKLFGETGLGENPAPLYSWSVTGPGSPSISNPTDPNVSFIPTTAGTYTVTLTVTNSGTMCSSTTHETITANPQPSAPTIAFVGDSCISDAPVELTASGCSGELHWGNGATGANTLYFTPGVVTAYCFDPAIGCNSDTAIKTIVRQPDLDALLTGCYEKCKSQSSGYLPLYSLAAYLNEIWYRWNYPGGILSGYYINNGNPLLLPYGLGDHYLTVSAPDPSCPRTSSVLRIDEKEVCDCDSVDVTYTMVPQIEECEITYLVDVTICNRSKTKKFCIDDIELLYPQDNVTITAENLTYSSVGEVDCDVFQMRLHVSSLIPSEVIVRLTDTECMNCTKDFVIDLKMDLDECEEPVVFYLEDINSELSNDVAAYFDFSAVLGSSNLLAFWSEPPMVVNYNLSGSTLQGLGMIDMAQLSQLAMEDGMVCFYAIVCVEDKLCLGKYCFSADDLYEMIQSTILPPEMATGRARTSADGLRLKPNPTTGEVNVIGTGDEIVEVLVMDMHGRSAASFDGTARFNIATLSSGMYIVRVKTRSADGTEHITYLSLAKK